MLIWGAAIYVLNATNLGVCSALRIYSDEFVTLLQECKNGAPAAALLKSDCLHWHVEDLK